MSDPIIPSSTPEQHQARKLAPYAGLALLCALGYGVYAHVARNADIRALAATRLHQVPELRTIIVHETSDPVTLDLPAESIPIETAAISARASGYIERRMVDIGTVVKAGQVLAVIRAPELDQQVARAQASLAQARADLDLAQVTAKRTGGLVDGGAVSKQNYDSDRLTQQARQAAQAAATAALGEVAQRQGFTTVTAPFDGVVTVRNVEAGDLVSADSTAQPLFVIARTDRLRVRVHVPQEQAHLIAMGTPVSALVPEFPGQSFTGTVTRTGHALERDSRMLPVEVELDNHDGRLAAGLYMTIHFALPRDGHTILVPAEAVNYEADGLSVATVSPDNHLQINHVIVGRDFGAQIEILQGLADRSQLVVHPPSALRQGDPVTPRPDVPEKGA